MSSDLRALSDLVVAMMSVYSRFSFCSFYIFITFHRITEHSKCAFNTRIYEWAGEIHSTYSVGVGVFLIDIYHVLEQTYLSIATKIDMFLEVLVLK